MSAELTATIANSRHTLEEALPPYASGQIAGIEQVHGIASFFRSMGIARLLTEGISDPLFIAQMQSASSYVFGLARVPDDDKVTSLAGCFWDAVAAQYWDAAAHVVTLSRMTHNPKREHEDDFWYVSFLMHRYFLAPAAAAASEEQETHSEAQQQRLERWDEVLEGGLDPRLDLCQALLDGDPDAFAETLVATGDERDAKLRERQAKGRLRPEELAWLQPIWPEGLALLRFAEERDGFDLEELQVPGVPPVLRIDNPYTYHPDAWRSIDFRPWRRG